MLKKTIFSVLALTVLALLTALVIPAGRVQLARPVIAAGTPEIRFWCLEQLKPLGLRAAPALRTWLAVEDLQGSGDPGPGSWIVFSARHGEILEWVCSSEEMTRELAPELIAAEVFELRRWARGQGIELAELSIEQGVAIRRELSPLSLIPARSWPRPLLLEALSSEDPARQAAAALALVGNEKGSPLAAPLDAELVASLTRLARAPGGFVSFAALATLSADPRSQSRDILEGRLQGQASALRHRSCVDYFRYFLPLGPERASGEPRALADQVLRSGLASKDAMLRLAAAGALIEQGRRDPALEAIILSGLSLDKAGAAQGLALTCLEPRRIPARAAIRPLLELTTAEAWRRRRELRECGEYEGDLDEAGAIASRAFEAFERYGASAREPLAGVLASAAPHLRAIAIEACAFVPPNAELRAALREAARDPDPVLRRAAASVLCELPWHELDWIDEALFGDDVAVALYAASAIERRPSTFLDALPDVRRALEETEPSAAILRACAAFGPLMEDAAPRLRALRPGADDLEHTLARLRVGDGDAAMAERCLVVIERVWREQPRLARRIIAACIRAPMPAPLLKSFADLLRTILKRSHHLRLKEAADAALRSFRARLAAPR